MFERHTFVRTRSIAVDSEVNPRWCYPITLVIGYNFHFLYYALQLSATVDHWQYTETSQTQE